jgi:hypothetical protein
MWRWFVPVLGLLALGCSGGGSGSFAAPGALTLNDGPYSLRIARTATAICAASGSGPGTSIQLEVSVRAAGGGWQVTMSDTTAGNLLLTLTRQGDQVSGRISGQGTAGPMSVTMADSAVTGVADVTPRSVTGSIAGNVTYATAAGQNSCTENTWTLTPR